MFRIFLFSFFVISFLSLDFSLISSYPVSKTIIAWSRQLRTCDAGVDLDLPTQGTTRLIYAVNDENIPSDDEDVYYHTRRGTKNVNLLDYSPAVIPLPEDVRNITIMSNSYPIPTSDSYSTYYHCQGFKRTFTEKVHVVEFVPQIDFNNSALVHHILLFICPDGLSPADLAFRGDCYGGKITPGLAACDQKRVASGWAVGGGSLRLPQEAGYPIFPGDSYWMLQIHYHNPDLIRGVVDSAGFLLQYTPTLRMHDAAALEINVPVQYISIPAKSPAYDIQAVCPGSCQKNLTANGINVYGSMLHTHLAGVKVKVEHVRNGIALPNLDENIYYDFNYQQVVTFPPGAKKIMNQDSIRLTCTYNTMDRLSTTRGGLATTDEMCIVYLFYYPAHQNPNQTYTFCQSVKSGSGNAATYSGACNGVGAVQNYRGVQFNIQTPLPTPNCTKSPYSHSYTVGSAGTRYVAPSAFDFSSYSRSTPLDDEGKYILHWNITLDSTGANGIANFAAEVVTNGWVGLGVSPTGSMIQSDSVIGWVNTAGGKSIVSATDRFNGEYAMPAIDPSQDIFNVIGTQGIFDWVQPPISNIYYNVPSVIPFAPAPLSSSASISSATPSNPVVSSTATVDIVSSSASISSATPSNSVVSSTTTVGIVSSSATPYNPELSSSSGAPINPRAISSSVNILPSSSIATATGDATGATGVATSASESTGNNLPSIPTSAPPADISSSSSASSSPSVVAGSNSNILVAIIISLVVLVLVVAALVLAYSRGIFDSLLSGRNERNKRVTREMLLDEYMDARES